MREISHSFGREVTKGERFMSYVLRDYQQKASDAAVSFFNNKAKKTNAIMVLPTGSGKIKSNKSLK